MAVSLRGFYSLLAPLEGESMTKRLVVVAAIGLTLHSARSFADADLPVVNTRYNDPLDNANRRVGVAGTDLGSGESVALFNGNLHVEHPSSPSFPVDGGGSFSLSRVYDSARVTLDEVETSPTTSGYATRGLSWVGLGWKSHFGRFFSLPLYWDGHDKRYENQKNYFEMPSGEVLPVRWNANNLWFYSQKKAIDIRGEYFEMCPMPTWPGPIPCCSGNPPKCEDAPACEPPPDRCAGRPNDEHPNAKHYVITLPGGTRYLMELIVPYVYDPTTHYLKNADRAGWYTTRITDINGNWIKIEYERSGNYPEAIRQIYSSSRQNPGDLINETPGDMGVITTLCKSTDPTTQCPSSAIGALKRVIATGFKGARSAPQKTVYEFFYSEEQLYDTISPDPGLTNKRRVPLLSKVKVYGLENGVALDAGTTEYVYGNPDAVSPNPQRAALLEKILYPPFSAASVFTYGSPLCQQV